MAIENKDIGGKTELTEERLLTEALDLYRAWHVAMGKDRSIIDFDLTNGPSSFEAIISRFSLGTPTRTEHAQIVRALKDRLTLVENCHPQNSTDQHNLQFAKSQIEASHMYARKLRGDDLDIAEYVETTMGVEFAETKKEEIEAQRQKVFSLLTQLGIDNPNRQSINDWRKENQLAQDEADQALRNASRDAITSLANFLGEEIKVEFDIERVKLNAYWWVWAYTHPLTRRFVLRQNFSQERQKIWTPGKAEELGWHETAGHLARMTLRKKTIQEGKLHPFFGLTTVHGPEAPVEEGLAQTLVFFVPDAYESLSTEGKLQVEQTILRSMVYGNVHVMVNKPQFYSRQEIIDYVHQYMPWETADEILEQITERTRDPLKQTYLYAYAGARRHLAYAQSLSDEGKKAFLNNIFARPYNSVQEETMFQELISDPKNVATQTAHDEKTPLTEEFPYKGQVAN